MGGEVVQVNEPRLVRSVLLESNPTRNPYTRGNVDQVVSLAAGDSEVDRVSCRVRSTRPGTRNGLVMLGTAITTRDNEREANPSA